MFLIVPLFAFLGYLAVGFVLSGLLFRRRGILFFLSMIAVIGTPFVIEEVYKNRLIRQYSPTCEALISAPLGLNAASTVLVFRQDISDPLFRGRVLGRLASPGESIRGPLFREFYAVFRERLKTDTLTLLSTKSVAASSLCAADEDETDCGRRLFSEHPSLNLVTSVPGTPTASHTVRYSVWGSAIDSGKVVHEWTKFVKFRGSIRDGGWAFWWPYPGSSKLLECTSSNLTFINWLTNSEAK